MLSEAVAERRTAAVTKEYQSSLSIQRDRVGRLAQHCWLLAALSITLVFTWRSMSPLLGPTESVQDDARQHVFWLARLRDPELFPNDLVADYFQALAPPGYVALYWALSQIGRAHV